MRQVVCAAVAAAMAAGSLVRAEDTTRAAVTGEMRRALGGDAALDAIRTVRGTGTAIRALGDLRVAGGVEIVMALPGRYLRTDRLRMAGLTSEVVTGIDGTAFLQRATGPSGVRIDPSAALDPDVRAAVVAGAARGARHDMIRLLLALLGQAPGASLTFRGGGRAEGPDFTADVLQVEGTDGFAARLFVENESRLPLMMSWEAPDTPGAIRRFTASYKAAEAGGSKTSTADLLSQAQAFVEHRLYFSEYRAVDGLTWPHRLRRTAGAEPIEDITLERWWVNPRLDARQFDPDR